MKRKTSREEGFETNTNSEPQGILKRKTSTSTNEETQGHMTIADTVLLAITGGVPTTTEDHVKPILKKKSFSGEEVPSESVSLSETPRPILKKKTSVEVEDVEEKHHVRPILKLRKDSSGSSGSAFIHVSSIKQDQKVDASSNEDYLVLLNTDGADRESESSSSMGSSVPILKKSESEPNSGAESGSASVNRFNKIITWCNDTVLLAPGSNSDAHKRRSLDVVPIRDESCLTRPPRPLSVAERIMNMESFLASEGYLDCSSSSASTNVTTGALPKKIRDRDRFRTQPITALEIRKSKRYVLLFWLFILYSLHLKLKIYVHYFCLVCVVPNGTISSRNYSFN